MTDSAPTMEPVPFQGGEVSRPINDLLAIPEIVDQLPDWVRVPFRRFVRLRQRNWPAKSVKRSTSLLCRHLTAMIQYLNEEGCCQDWTDWSVRLIEAYIDDKLRYGWARCRVRRRRCRRPLP
jgi:hypothetical protein